VSTPASLPDILRRAVEILDQLRIPYLVGGSVASSIHGIVRYTQDADLVIDLRADQAEQLISELSREFYVSRVSVDEAIASRRSFNAIHRDSAFKLDLFVLGREPFDREEFSRRVIRSMPGLGLELVFKTAEDTILRKLQWFRDGGEASEVQWRDLLGVLAVSGDRLDYGYLDRWARTLGLEGLLGRAREQVGSLRPPERES
jgi:hypothetical protein